MLILKFGAKVSDFRNSSFRSILKNMLGGHMLWLLFIAHTVMNSKILLSEINDLMGRFLVFAFLFLFVWSERMILLTVSVNVNIGNLGNCIQLNIYQVLTLLKRSCTWNKVCRKYTQRACPSSMFYCFIIFYVIVSTPFLTFSSHSTLR